MNDFTKEELKDMLSIFNESIESDTQPECIYLLRDKIQSMIDNYCEHKETENIGGWASKCVNCGMKFGDETQ